MNKLDRAARLIFPFLLLTNAVTSAQSESMQPESRRDCAVCHLQWVDAFDRPQTILLIDPPPEAAEAQDDTCLGCHDGSVGDSRRRIWLEHGHKTGVEPPETMKVPDILPLEEGKIVCRTCHTAHSGAGPETLATSMFIRVRNDTSQLCELCHPEYTKGPELGTHPVGGMPWPVPEQIVNAGARIGPDQNRLICQTCHTPHGAREDHLLVMGTQSSQLCLTCHQKLRPGLWRPDLAREHPQNPPLSSDMQRQAIKDMGTKTGAGDTLICLSCHKLHHGLAGRDMLADTLDESRLCLRCHPDRSEIMGTAHDLRQSAPNTKNRLGQIPQQSGPCGACHSFHQYARNPESTKFDTTGLCANCHQAGRCAEKASGLPFSHPLVNRNKDWRPDLKLTLYPSQQDNRKKKLACLSCHEPHQAKRKHFLRSDSDELCSVCHDNYATTLAGPHDFTGHPDLINGKGHTAQQTGKCGFCHGVHNAHGPAMWVATKNTPANPDALCKECHRPGGLAADSPVPELRHPTGPETAKSAQQLDCKLPLFNAKGHWVKKGFVACSSCHDLHAGLTDPENLLRKGDQPLASSMCMQCHHHVQNMHLSMHSEPVIHEYAQNAGIEIPSLACGPCHIVHVKPGMSATGMWAAPLGYGIYPIHTRRCTGCHGPTGRATQINPVVHPVVSLQNVNQPKTPGFMPLVNEEGDIGHEGQITCLTCHLPHGRVPGEGYPIIDPSKTTRDELRALRPMVRPYSVPNLCSSCHGFDGLRRFLYYHHPEKRYEQGSTDKTFSGEKQ